LVEENKFIRTLLRWCNQRNNVEKSPFSDDFKVGRHHSVKEVKVFTYHDPP